MSGSVKHISVCICTFKRPILLRRLLGELDKQQTEGLFTYSIIVADNDREELAKKVVSEFSAQSLISAKYCVEPVQNIALARNKALENAEGDFIAFIDDDEFPTENWLWNLFKTCTAYRADGVLGPVLPHFEHEPPEWIKKGGFFDRVTHETGYKIGISDARTGNALLKRKILEGRRDVFQTEFRTGGEDVDFFQRMMDKGHVFIWCNEAVVYEVVPPGRCKRSYLLKRSLLRGGNSIRQRSGRAGKITKSLIVLPIYGLALPFLLLAGDRHFMKYFIKFCEHGGRILALLGISPVTERDS